MGEIAEGILNGDFDEVTGEYLGEGMGFPRSLYHERRNYHRRQGKTTVGPLAIKGVKNFLHKRNFIKYDEVIIRLYGTELKIEEFTQICEVIQKDFGTFVQWVSKLDKNLYLNK